MMRLLTLMLIVIGAIALTAWLRPAFYEGVRADYRWLPKVDIEVEFEGRPALPVP